MSKKLCILACTAMCVLMLSFAAPAQAGKAANFAISWGLGTTADENFNFGNPVSFSTANLPAQVQGSIFLGTLETYIMSALIFGP
ncbi:MAG: hypothetical protein ACLGQH_09480 [Acidobacteriota bacterium]